MCRWVWICGVTTSKVITLVLQGTQSRLKRQNTLFKTLNFVTKVFMMRQLLMSNCLFGMCCQAWICGVTRKKNVVSLVLQGAPSRLKRQMNKFFEWRIITQAVRTASYHILFNAPHCRLPFLKLTHKAFEYFDMLASVHQVIKEICIKHVNMKCQSTGDKCFFFLQ